MENLNTEVIENVSKEAMDVVTSVKPSTGRIIAEDVGFLGLCAAAGYGLYTLGKKAVKWGKKKRDERKAKKANAEASDVVSDEELNEAE